MKSSNLWAVLILMAVYQLAFSRTLLPPGNNAVVEESLPAPPSPFQAPPPLKQPPPLQKTSYSPFRPSIAVLVGVLTTIFSMTFLLLLYAKHCRQGHDVVGYLGEAAYPSGITPVSARKNSGIDPLVIESLPVFRFGSLTGQKEGLECAVCLNRFEPVEVLRLLPKCKHAFHVECVDTWLDAHSTCPLCRYQVDPEDVLLVDRNDPLRIGAEGNASQHAGSCEPRRKSYTYTDSTRRISGRHSSAGEKGSGCGTTTPPCRRSSDGFFTATVGCFDRPRKDELLVTADQPSYERRLEHRIIISRKPQAKGLARKRWSDVQPCDLLYLRSEMLMTRHRRSSSSKMKQHWNHRKARMQQNRGESSVDEEGGRSIINGRSVSEITGLSRFASNERETGIS